MWLCNKTQLAHSTYSREKRYRRRLPISYGNGSTGETHRDNLWNVETRPIEVNVQSAGVSEEEQVFFTDDDDETEAKIWERKKTKP